MGYRQAWEFLEGACDRAELRQRGIYATRQLAKRQLTWLRAMPEPKIFDCLAPDLTAQVISYLAPQWPAAGGGSKRAAQSES